MAMHGPVHPGLLVRDSLSELGLSVTDAAARLGMSRPGLSRVLNARAAVSPMLAVRLERAGLGTAKLWVRMQAAHDLARAAAHDTPDVQRLDPTDDGL
jgi:addiction module HigA family antidote